MMPSLPLQPTLLNTAQSPRFGWAYRAWNKDAIAIRDLTKETGDATLFQSVQIKANMRWYNTIWVDKLLSDIPVLKHIESWLDAWRLRRLVQNHHVTPEAFPKASKESLNQIFV